MNLDNSNKTKATKVLFVWDGSADFIRSADQFVSTLGNAQIGAMHTMPHESIHSYSTVVCEEKEPSRLERKLHLCYKRQVERSKHLKATKLEILFGDRIAEIVRFASLSKTNYVLMARFEQTSFSKWIHGDLNQKLVKRLDCAVVYLEPVTQKLPLGTRTLWEICNPTKAS